jgi:hypothetical protein
MPIDPPLVIANGAQLRLLYSFAGQTAVNVYGAVVTGSVTFDQALANSLATSIKGAWTSNLASLCNANTHLFRVGIRDLRSANAPEFLDTQAVASGSATAVDSLPPQLALCVTLRTAKAGKSFRGRSYIGGFDEAQNDTNGLTSQATATATIAFVTAIDTALKANGMALGVISRPANARTITKTTAARAGAVNQVTLIESRNLTWETQRRRMNGRAALPTAFQSAAVQQLT